MLTARNLGFRSAWLVCVSLSILLSGCSGDDSNSPTGATSSTGSSAPPSATGSSVPTIELSGTPPTSVVAGNAYTFQPTASTTTGTATFSVSGLPSWARFNSSTGEISGTPASGNVGTTGTITISASDGSATASMAPFQIDVKAAPAATGSATLSWTAPTDNTNGTPLTNLAGYHIYYGTTSGQLTSVITVPSATTTEYEISNLSSGTYYFMVVAYNTLGIDSAPSNEESKTI